MKNSKSNKLDTDCSAFAQEVTKAVRDNVTTIMWLYNFRLLFMRLFYEICRTHFLPLA